MYRQWIYIIETRWCLEPRGLSVSRGVLAGKSHDTIPTGINIYIYIRIIFTRAYILEDWSYHTTRARVEFNQNAIVFGSASHLNSDKPFWTRRYYTAVQEDAVRVRRTLIIYPSNLSVHRWAASDHHHHHHNRWSMFIQRGQHPVSVFQSLWVLTGCLCGARCE